MRFFIVFIFLLFSYSPQAFAQCVNPAGVPGEVQFNTSHDVFQGCTSRGWMAFHPPALAADDTPDVFGFTDQTAAATSTIIISNSVTITGIDAATAVTISGAGTPEFRINGGSWVTNGAITDGQTLELRLTSNAAASTMNSATVTVGTLSDQWDVTTGTGCPATPSSGDEGCDMPDGSIYAGESPDGNVAMYTTPADAGQFSWNDGTSTWVDTAMVNCKSAQASCDTGEANTSLLVGLGTSPSPAPYVAARHCDNLTAHGHSDWYLPARYELAVLRTNRTAIGGFNLTGSNPAGWYWSSSERGYGPSWLQRFSDGVQLNGGKSVGLSVRCVRR